MATNGSQADPLTTVEVDATPTAPSAPTPEGVPVPADPVAAAAPRPAEPAASNLGATPQGQESSREATGVGSDGETNVWEARYSMKNFLGRLTFWGVATVAWIGLALWVWADNHPDYSALAIISGIALGIAWLVLIRRIVLARFGHYYRLTNRRIFVSTGVFTRRRDQMELLRINDVFTRQTLVGRWLSVGTVVVVSAEPQLPMVYLAGVDDPKYVMDLIWHHARSERDRRSVKVDQV